MRWPAEAVQPNEHPFHARLWPKARSRSGELPDWAVLHHWRKRRAWRRTASWSRTSCSTAIRPSGAETSIFSFACLGIAPQDLKYAGELNAARTVGDNNSIREYVTISRTVPLARGGVTTVSGLTL